MRAVLLRSLLLMVFTAAATAAQPGDAGLDQYLETRIRDTHIPGMVAMAWAGIFNTEFWIDPQKGIGGILLMQYLPFYDKAAIETLQGFEQRVYQSL